MQTLSGLSGSLDGSINCPDDFEDNSSSLLLLAAFFSHLTFAHVARSAAAILRRVGAKGKGLSLDAMSTSKATGVTTL